MLLTPEVSIQYLQLVGPIERTDMFSSTTLKIAQNIAACDVSKAGPGSTFQNMVCLCDMLEWWWYEQARPCQTESILVIYMSSGIIQE